MFTVERFVFVPGFTQVPRLLTVRVFLIQASNKVGCKLRRYYEGTAHNL